MSTVAIVTAGGSDAGTAVGARVMAFAQGLEVLGWQAQIIEVRPPHGSRFQNLIEQRMPAKIRALMDMTGCEGDVMPSVWWQARQRLASVSADVAIVSVPPFSLLAAVDGLAERMPVVVDYRDPWSARTRPHLAGRASRSLERMCLKRAEMVTFAGHPELRQIIEATLGVPEHRVVAVPNGLDLPDLQGIPPFEINSERNQQPLDVVFVGHWYGRNGPGILAEALGRVGPTTARLTAIGSVSPSIDSQLYESTQGEYAALPAVTRTELYERLSRADVAVLTMDYASAVESRIPAKFYDYIGLGIPVIAVCPPDTGLLRLPEARHVHHIDHRDVDSLEQLLREAAADRTRLNVGQAERLHYARTVGVKSMHEALLRVLDTDSRG